MREERATQLRKLTEVSRALTYAVSLDEVLTLTVDRAAELLEAQKAVLMLTNEDGLLAIRASHGLDKETCERFREPLHETLIARLQNVLGEPQKERFLGVPLVVAGEVTGLLAVARPSAAEDVEEEEWLLSALADQAAVALEKTRLDETAEFRERLIGIVSHDLRNPISAILFGAGSLLHRDDLDARATKTIVRIQSAAERASRLIRDLLDFTQARLGGGIRITRRPAELRAVVQHVVEELQVAYPERQIAVESEGDTRGSWDEDRLAQVAGNLLGNAMQYGAPKTVVRVATRETKSGVELTIENEGAAIPAARLSRIFDPMQRGTEAGSGTRSVGLGLYIVKELVEAHGGTVAVSSDDARTVFTVRLPRA